MKNEAYKLGGVCLYMYMYLYTVYVLNAKTRNSSEIILSVFRHRFYDIHT